jgi:hypothetical protein
VGDAACVAVPRRRCLGNKNRYAPIETEISIKTASQDPGFHANSAEIFYKNRKSIKTACHRQTMRRGENLFIGCAFPIFASLRLCVRSFFSSLMQGQAEQDVDERRERGIGDWAALLYSEFRTPIQLIMATIFKLWRAVGEKWAPLARFSRNIFQKMQNPSRSCALVYKPLQKTSPSPSGRGPG